MVEDLIRRARRRFLFNETLAQSGFRRVAAFGPAVPVALGHPNLAGITPGLATAYPAVEVFQAAAKSLVPASPVTALPASATVTTRTIQPLPIMTPSIVNPARSLFDQSA